MGRRESPGRAKQIFDMLSSRPWRNAPTRRIVACSATISIFADRPTPSAEMHVTTSGASIRSL